MTLPSRVLSKGKFTLGYALYPPAYDGCNSFWPFRIQRTAKRDHEVRCKRCFSESFFAPTLKSSLGDDVLVVAPTGMGKAGILRTRS